MNYNPRCSPNGYRTFFLGDILPCSTHQFYVIVRTQMRLPAAGVRTKEDQAVARWGSFQFGRTQWQV